MKTVMQNISVRNVTATLLLFIYSIGMAIATPQDKTGTMRAPYIEWSIDNPTYSGNPFDLISTVTIAHTDNGTTNVTEMLYAGRTTCNFRIIGTINGNYTLSSINPYTYLSSQNGTKIIRTCLNSEIKDFAINPGTKVALQLDDERPLNGQFESYLDTNHVDAYIQQTKENGFDSMLLMF